MQANVKDLEKSQVEISVELTPEEFQKMARAHIESNKNTLI